MWDRIRIAFLNEGLALLLNENDKRLKNVTDNDQKGGQEFNIDLLPKANSLGINLQTVIKQIRQAYFGLEIQRLQRGKDEVKVWLRYTKEERENRQMEQFG